MYKLMVNTINEMGFLELPIYGIVPPRSTYTLVVTMGQNENLPEEGEVDLIMLTVIIDEYISFDSKSKYDQYIEKAKPLENKVHNLALKATYAPRGKTTCELVQQANPPITEIISVHKIPKGLRSLDANQTEPWVLSGDSCGSIDIWNYETQKSMCVIQADEASMFLCVKFIEQKQWFIAGSTDGIIYVYSYKTMFDNKTEVKKITSFHSDDFIGNKGNPELAVISLAVHPTKPYVLSSCGMCIKLWDWDKNWECIQTSEKQVNHTLHMTFDPEDTNCFVACSFNSKTVKIWDLDPLEPKYTLSGHRGEVNSLDFFIRNDQQYLITSSDDKTAKIWDMQTRACIYTLESFMSSVLSAFSHPSVPVLITVTTAGDIHVWSATSFRLQRILRIGGGTLLNFHHIMGKRCTLLSNRVAIGFRSRIWMMELHDEEADAGQGSNENPV